MLVELTKADLINLAKSALPKDIMRCAELDRLGYLRWTGNQHNESWEWNEKFLEALNENELFELYKQNR